MSLFIEAIDGESKIYINPDAICEVTVTTNQHGGRKVVINYIGGYARAFSGKAAEDVESKLRLTRSHKLGFTPNGGI